MLKRVTDDKNTEAMKKYLRESHQGPNSASRATISRWVS